MFFQVEISPVQKPKVIKKPAVQIEEVPILSLAPFTAIPKVFFDNVLIGTHASRTLIIHNPTPNDIKLYITKAPPEERCFELSWVECLIRSQEKVTLELFWQPINEGGWKDSLIFEDGGRIKKDVAVIFKAVKPKKPKVKPKKVVKCVSTKVKSPRKWFSPKQKSPKSRLVLPDITNIPQINIESPKSDVAIRNVRILNENTYVKNKENFAIRNVRILNENTYVKNKENLDISGIENLSFASADLPKKKTFTGVDVNYRTEENFDDSLEADKNIISTRPSVTCAKRDFGTGTPLSMEEKLNALMFTPTSNGFEPHSFSTEDGTRILASNRLDFDNAISNICNAMPLNTDPNFE
ncbi:Abnormal spindle-like microcephaly-assoc'd, ASPM-SPD-2-Hydin [Popillia japonica]|uniref:Abnormal spindle-like microcephaly-assoc'd, ASPM-SPD-2-Hydin n=1 Tax=Popillia japonica TaxID=7064 RepID=A0AAW1MEN0_POPJA